MNMNEYAVKEEEIIEISPLERIAQEVFKVPFLYPIQRFVIDNIIQAADSLKSNEKVSDLDHLRNQIVILPTGSGKSLCFMLPALLVKGITIIVFPLLSLMADQKRRLEEADLEAGILKGGMTSQEKLQLYKDLESGKTRFLLTNPESLIVPETLKQLKTLPLIHLVVDECHIIAEWGDTFRPAYLKLKDIYSILKVPIVSAFTATATEDILNRIKTILFEDRSPNIIAQDPDRTNISYEVFPTLCKNRALIKLLKGKSPNKQTTGVFPLMRPAIIFCKTRTETELTARELREGLKENEIFFYHAGLSPLEKKSVEEWFYKSNNGILAATCAYGMGVDKKNIRTVIHRYVPESITSFLQESGRGGRDKEYSRSLVLLGPEDTPSPSSSLLYQRLYSVFTDNSRCRREALLKLMNVENTWCEGCDVCNGTTLSHPEEENILLKIFKRYKACFDLKTASIFLKGWYSPKIIANNLHKLTFFGVFKEWKEEEIEKLLNQAIKKGRLALTNKKKIIPNQTKRSKLSKDTE